MAKGIDEAVATGKLTNTEVKALRKVKAALEGNSGKISNRVVKYIGIKDIEDLGNGRFKIISWDGYLGDIKPDGPFLIIEGDEYIISRKQADRINAKLRKQNSKLDGMQVHEINPVKFGGNPIDINNKIIMTTNEHILFTVFWNRLLNRIERGKYE
jgi:toxin YxiD